MCGITARVGQDDSVGPILNSLENLSYRGYDSAGIAVQNGQGIVIRKRKGQISDLKSVLSPEDLTGSIAIGHTRWSTHGRPTDQNAHPHVDCTGRIAVVHNGIIENYAELRRELEDRGHDFESETDSEVVPHLIEERVRAGESLEEAFRDAVSRLRGSYALAMIADDDDRVYATRSGSPMVLSIGDEANYLASDVPAFLQFTDRVVYLEDGDFAVITTSGYRVTDAEGNPKERPIEVVEWDSEDAQKEGFDHYMLKEIFEQPRALEQALNGRVEDGTVVLDEFSPGAFDWVRGVQLVACGTSFHAGLYGERLLADRGIPADTFLASEYAAFPPPIGEDTLVLGVTQSGETADTLEALRLARQRGARTLALTNVVGSTAARECDDALFIRAGPEIGVAATKTYSSQVVTMALFAQRIAADTNESQADENDGFLEALCALPEYTQAVLDQSRAAEVAARYLDGDAHFFIGRGSARSAAVEGALKFKEITYEHAEGFAAGELKHGPLALVTAETPTFAIGTGHHLKKLESNVREIQTRNGPVIGVVPRTATEIIDIADDVLQVPATNPDLVAVLANVQLQLVAYHTAAELGRPIDKPRNLAKSVTVE